jgi:5-methylcytosine-specific restriction protein A
MRISLEVLRSQVADMAGLEGVDSRALTGDEAVEWIRAGGEAMQSLQAILGALTARVTELSSGKDRTTRFARAKGFADTPSLLTEVAQIPRAQAGQLVTLGRAMSDADAGSSVPLTVGGASIEPDAPLPLYAYLAQQVGRPGFSTEKAAIIRTTLEKMAGATPEIEKSLVDRAKKRPIERVRVMCREEWERVDHDGYLRHLRSLREKAYVKFWDTDEGMIGIHGELDPIRGLALREWVEDNATRGMRKQRKLHESEQRSRGELAADALSDLAVHRMGCQDGPKSAQTTVVVHAPAEDVVRGKGAMFCHGYAGPLCLELLSQVAFGLEIAPAVTGKGGLALFLGTSTRFFTPGQKRAIALRDRGCARCGAPVAMCDVHHIQFWSEDGPTDINNGVLLCSGCHHRLHDFGWIIEVIAGEVWFIPPASVDPKRRRIPACSTRSPAPTG